jgi:curved DNA-binding protein CbpA
MNYFEHCQSVEEAKKRYRKLLMQYRPNNCGDSMSRTTVNNVAWAGANKICYTGENQQRRPDHQRFYF